MHPRNVTMTDGHAYMYVDEGEEEWILVLNQAGVCYRTKVIK